MAMGQAEDRLADLVMLGQGDALLLEHALVAAEIEIGD